MLLGACKPYRKIGALIGALPVGLKGKIYGQPFKVLIQYDAFGGVKAQIYEDEQGGGMIAELSGRKGEAKTIGSGFGTWAYLRYKKDNKDKFPFNNQQYGEKDRKAIERDIRKRAEALVKNLHKEVVDFNKGKDTKTVKAGPVNIGPKKTATKKQSTPKAKYKTIDIRTYNVPAYTVPKHKRRIRIK